MYFTVEYKINDKSSMTLKYNDDQEFVGLTLSENITGIPSKDFMNMRLYVPLLNNFGFTQEQINNMSKQRYGLSDETISINNWKIYSSLDSGISFPVFSIQGND